MENLSTLPFRTSIGDNTNWVIFSHFIQMSSRILLNKNKYGLLSRGSTVNVYLPHTSGSKGVVLFAIDNILNCLAFSDNSIIWILSTAPWLVTVKGLRISWPTTFLPYPTISRHYIAILDHLLERGENASSLPSRRTLHTFFLKKTDRLSAFLDR